jgi:hypothetical protein
VKIFINKNSKITKAVKSCFMAQSNEELFYEISTHMPLRHPIQKKIIQNTPKRPLKGSFLTFCMEDCLLKLDYRISLQKKLRILVSENRLQLV